MSAPPGTCPETIPGIWVLTDGRPGHDHQALGVAEALGWPFADQAGRLWPAGAAAQPPARPQRARSERHGAQRPRGTLARSGDRRRPPYRAARALAEAAQPRRVPGAADVAGLGAGSRPDRRARARPRRGPARDDAHPRHAEPGDAGPPGSGRGPPRAAPGRPAAPPHRLSGRWRAPRHAVHAWRRRSPGRARRPARAKPRRQPAGRDQPPYHERLRGRPGRRARSAAPAASLRPWRGSLRGCLPRHARQRRCRAGDRGFGVDVQRGLRHRPAGFPRPRAECWPGQARDAT